VLAGIGASNAFITKHKGCCTTNLLSSTVPDQAVDVRTGKRTGTSFLPSETVDRASKGSPIEKVKLEKDGTSAFVDVYEYAAKIRSGQMTWEEVEKADLDTVRQELIITYTQSKMKLASSYIIVLRTSA
jgi:hypothetical protein